MKKALLRCQQLIAILSDEGVPETYAGLHRAQHLRARFNRKVYSVRRHGNHAAEDHLVKGNIGIEEMVFVR